MKEHIKMKRKKYITIFEYSRIYIGDIIDGVTVSNEDIVNLKEYIDLENSKNDGNTISSFLKPIKNGVQVNNYVGIIQTKSGLTIEILPKLYKHHNDKQEIRNLFIRMLKEAYNVKGKTFNSSHLDTSKNNLLEVYISMFLKESDTIIKKGLKLDYVKVQCNENFLKGKLKIKEQIQYNSFNKAKFYNEYNKYLANIPENIIIKTTLEYLLKISRNNMNIRLIKEQLIFFENVNSTYDFNDKFSKIKNNRHYKYYNQALEWANIFLNNSSFTSFKGNTLAYAILFPMEKIFESYISTLMKKYIKKYHVFNQDSKYYLFDNTSNNKGYYKLIPDIVLSNESTTIIIDTKWKILIEKGPTQADLYQMYAYFTRYNHKKNSEINKVILLYPFSEDYDEKEFTSFDSNGEISSLIEVKFIDLFIDDIESEINKIID